MAENTATRYAEYAHEVASVGKLRLLRRLFIASLVLFCLAYIYVVLVPFKMPQTIVGLPIFVRVIWVIVWRYLSYDCITTIEDGNFLVHRVSKRLDRKDVSCRVTDFLFLGEDTEDNRAYIVRAYGVKIISHASEAEVPIRMLGVWKKETAFYAFSFDAYEGIVKELKYYNAEAFQKK